MNSVIEFILDCAVFANKHQLTIAIATALTCWVCGIAVWQLGKKARASEGWAWYLAAAFLTFAVNYTFSPLIKSYFNPFIYSLFRLACSVVNNIFFWLAANELFKQKTAVVQATKTSLLTRLSLIRTLPQWIWCNCSRF